jgi:hypothetical protein
VNPRELELTRRGSGRTRTEYCLPARIQGDSVRLKNISTGLLSVLSCRSYLEANVRGTKEKRRTSMITVPFCDGPLQYCAGKELLLAQLGYGWIFNTVLITGRQFVTYVDAPTKRRDALADDGVLVDREDFIILEDTKDVGSDSGELPEAIKNIN